MAKEVAGFIKLQIKGGAANPSPPVGPALGSKGLNIMDFCKQFNARTQESAGKVLPVVITVYSDKSFSFEVKQPPPVAVQLKEAAKIASGSAEPNRKKVGMNQLMLHRIVQLSAEENALHQCCQSNGQNRQQTHASK